MLSIFFIGLSLSIDAFIVSLSIGMKISKIERIIIPLTIGIMHFIMPLIGHFLGYQVLYIINLNPKIIVAIILLYLAIIMYLDRKKEKKVSITSFISIILLAFSVSIDSFSVGLGLDGLTNKYLACSLIFSLCSSCITYIGLITSKYSLLLLKEKAIYLGIIILLIISIVNLCQVFC